jgi:hypothetical protein
MDGVVGSQVVITLTATVPVQRGEAIEYQASFTATFVSNTVIREETLSADEQAENSSEDEPSVDEDSEDETPGEELEEDESETDADKGKSKQKPPKEKLDAVVLHKKEGSLDLGPMPLKMKLLAISDAPVEITARLMGDWRGKGVQISTPAGVESQHIQVEGFSGKLEILHPLADIPSPLIVGVEAEDGAVTYQRRSPESPLDVFLRVRSMTLLDPVTGDELPWPEELLGPTPNRIKIKDGQLQFIKSAGTPEEVAVEAADEAEQAADAADVNATEAQNQPVKIAQQLAKDAAAAAREAAKKAEEAAREAQRAAEEAANEAEHLAAEKAKEAAEKAKEAAKKAEEAARKAGKEAADVNDDGKNDIFDLVLVARVFGMQVTLEVEGAISDINGDGVVNLFDLILVAQGLAGGAIIPDAGDEQVAGAPGTNIAVHPDVSLRLRQEAADADKGVFRVDLVANDAPGLYAFQFELFFDETALEVVSVEEGRLLSSDGAPTYWKAFTHGRSVSAVSTRIAPEGLSEPGVIASVNFKVKTDPSLKDNPISAGTLKIADAHGRIAEFKLDTTRLGKTASLAQAKALQNYPNPFNPETWIPYQLVQPAEVAIQIYDAAGQVVRTLNLGMKPSGYYLEKGKAAYWDGRNNAGERVASGVYFYRFQAGDYSATRKMIVVK